METSLGIKKPSKSLPDSDFDGLPDFIERDLRTNPNDPDTDGDGLSDFDEFADFERYIGLEQQFPRFFVDGASSERYGTDPTSCDSETDNLADSFELLVGYPMVKDGELRVIKTNPLLADTDFDGVLDSIEAFGKSFVGYDYPVTDAEDPDTDDDGRNDGKERTDQTDPLIPDILVTVTFAELKLNGGPNPFNAQWSFSVGLNSAFPGKALSTHNEFGAVSCGSQTMLPLPNLSQIPLGDEATWSFPLRSGQGFSVNLRLVAIATCGAIPTAHCDATKTESFTFEDVFAGGFSGHQPALTNSTCMATVTYFISLG